MQARKLLELPAVVQESIDAGKVPPSIGYEIAKVSEVGRAEVRQRTVKAPRPKRWSCAFDDGAEVSVTMPGRDVDPAAAVEKLRAALRKAKAEAARARSDAA